MSQALSQGDRALPVLVAQRGHRCLCVRDHVRFLLKRWRVARVLNCVTRMKRQSLHVETVVKDAWRSQARAHGPRAQTEPTLCPCASNLEPLAPQTLV